MLSERLGQLRGTACDQIHYAARQIARVEDSP